VSAEFTPMAESACKTPLNPNGSNAAIDRKITRDKLSLNACILSSKE
jgi:hypothetical protein